LTRTLWIVSFALGAPLAAVSMVYAAALDSDELRSHLPPELQVLWGHEPFRVSYPYESCILGSL